MVEEKRTAAEVSIALNRAFPHISRGLSTRSIRRYCASNGIHSTSRLKDDVVDRLVSTNILKVCISFQLSFPGGLILYLLHSRSEFKHES